MEERVKTLKIEISELDREWDRLDNMGSVPEKQSRISKKIGEKQEEMKALEDTIKFMKEE